MNKRVVFLYTELAPYITRCMEALVKSGVQVDVIAYPVNKEAPFDLLESEMHVKYHNRNKLSLPDIHQFLVEIVPHAIFCSGWIDKEYLQAVKKYTGNTRKVIVLDNKIEQGIKAKASRIRAKAKYRPYFDFAWVPGPPQKEFAKRIGFEEKDIWDKFYTADFERFRKLDRNPERCKFPKRFVYVGRYVDFKGINELFSAFMDIDNKGWELFCAGFGDLFNKRPKHPNIHHLGFVQPTELDNFVQEGGVFVLPSWKEPWGVVIHEFASAGFPIVCSEEVGASSVFLDQNKNGYTFQPKNKSSLVKALEKVISTPDADLFKMGALSKKQASIYTMQDWVKTAKEILNNE